LTEPKPSADTAGVIAPPPVIYALAIAVGVFLHRIQPLPFVPIALERAVGVPLVFAGVILFGWAIGTFHRAGTPAPPHHPTRAIVTDGPYRFTRNPIYIGFTLLHLGLAVWVNSLWVLVTLLPVLVVMHAGVILREERYLTRRFGHTYTEYAARVRRWI
jgi:protein-S-isoprenylcysteine O-methyltransferase Ste14